MGLFCTNLLFLLLSTIHASAVPVVTDTDDEGDVFSPLAGGGKGAAGHDMPGSGGSSVASAAFARFVRRFRREIDDSDRSKSDLSGMERAVQLLVFALAGACAAIIIAFSAYTVTITAYAGLIYAQGAMITTARFCAEAVRSIAAVNDGYT